MLKSRAVETEMGSARQPVLADSHRRRQIRFPIVLKLNFRMRSGLSGEGVLLNISSSGLLFRCTTNLFAGNQIEIDLPWPCLLNGNCPLQLRIRGRIVRSDQFGTAVAIQKHEFRTVARGKRGFTTPGVIVPARLIAGG